MHIFFDFDSTLVDIESLDVLIGRALKTEKERAALYHITEQGMNGEIDVNTSLTQRLKVATITRTMVGTLANELPQHIHADMHTLIKKLQAHGHTVHILTGGFEDYLAPACAHLGIAEENLHANAFTWNGDAVSGIESTRLTAHSGGKPQTIQTLNIPPESAIMVGDGATDLEAYEQGVANTFIGFGAYAQRATVKEHAPAYVTSISELETLLLKD